MFLPIEDRLSGGLFVREVEVILTAYLGKQMIPQSKLVYINTSRMIFREDSWYQLPLTFARSVVKLLFVAHAYNWRKHGVTSVKQMVFG